MTDTLKLKLRSWLLVVCDVFLINLSLVIAYLLRFDWDFRTISPHLLPSLPYIFGIAFVVKMIVFRFFKLYSSLWRYAGIYELMNIAAAVLISNSVVFAVVFLSQLSVPRSVYFIAIMTDMFFTAGVRFGYRIFRRIVKGEIIRFDDSKRVLIVGSGDATAMIIREMKNHPELKNHPVGIITDDNNIVGRKMGSVSVVGTIDNLEDIAEKLEVDEIIIAMPSATKSRLNQVYSKCSRTPCRIKILPSVSQLIDESVVMQRIRDVDIEDLLGREPVKLDNSELEAFLGGKNVIITGGGGSIGSELCRQIAGFGPKTLVILDNYENNAYDIQNELIKTYPSMDLKVVIASVREKQRLEEVFARIKPHVVFHAAAHKHVPLMEENPSEALKNNVLGTLNVAECADKFKAEKFVLISTDKAVNPTNVMGATKRIAEMIIQGLDRNSETEYVAVRFGNVLGSNGSVIPIFKKQIAEGGPVTVTDPEIIRYFMTIPEAVQLVLQAGAMAKGGEIFVLDMGQPVKIADLARNLIKLSGFEPDVDIKIKYTGLRPGEKLYEELLMAEEGLMATQNDKIFVAQPVHTDFAMLKREISILIDKAKVDENTVFEYLQNIVPTYKKAQ